MGTSIKLSTRTRKTGRQADRQTDVVPRLSSLSLSLSLVLSSPVPLISRMLLRAATPINQLINESINRHRKLGVHPGTPNPHPSIHPSCSAASFSAGSQVPRHTALQLIR